VTPEDVEVNEERPVDHFRERRVLVAREVRESAAGDLDQVQRSPPRAMVEHARAVELDLGDAVVVVEAPEQDLALAGKGELAPTDADALDVSVAPEEAASEELQEVLQSGAVELERGPWTKFFCGVGRDDEGVVASR
jgi:hypothetical protein